MKTTVRIILYTSQSNRTKTKGCPICLCVTKHRQRKYIHLRLHAQPSKWSDEACRYVKDRRVNPNYVKDNAFLTEQESMCGTEGFESAQVTAGGICTDEFDPVTMESRLVPGLYACGEVLDIDGDCGGYNLQWAWSSGYVAGQLGKQEEPR